MDPQAKPCAEAMRLSQELSLAMAMQAELVAEHNRLRGKPRGEILACNNRFCWAAVAAVLMAALQLRRAKTGGRGFVAIFWAVAVAGLIRASRPRNQGCFCRVRAALAAGFQTVQPCGALGHRDSERAHPRNLPSLPQTSLVVMSAPKSCGPDAATVVEELVEAKLSELHQMIDSRLKFVENEWPGQKLHLLQFGSRLVGQSEEMKGQVARLAQLENQINALVQNQKGPRALHVSSEWKLPVNSPTHCSESSVLGIAEAAVSVSKIESSLAELEARVRHVETFTFPASHILGECLLADDQGNARLDDMSHSEVCAKLEQLENESLEAQSHMEDLSLRLLLLQASQQKNVAAASVTTAPFFEGNN